VALRLDDVDLSDPGNFVDAVPHEMFEVLRRDAPVYWHAAEGVYAPGFWVLSKHDDVVNANRDQATFSSERKGTVLGTPATEADLENQRLMMLNMDPPRHTKLRLLVNKGFTPRHIAQLELHIREIANRIIDDVCGKGECDFVTAISAELPLQVIAEMLGVPQEDRHKLFQWSNTMIGFDDPEYGATDEERMDASAQIYLYANALAEQRRAEARDDIVTALLNAEVEGNRLTEMEFDLFFLLLSVAGNETTRNLISHAMLALIEHPDQRQKLLDDPSKVGPAVEEFLRWGTPVMYFRRTAQHDVEVRGTRIKEGDAVTIWYISANRDEDVFADPFRFDVERTPNEHVAFGGGGPHFCLGANLARMEIKVMFEELLRRLPDIELNGPVRRLRSNFINGIKEMPIAFTPAAPEA
jgi:cholest-4-en-3-one 26-monooxygenase